MKCTWMNSWITTLYVFCPWDDFFKWMNTVQKTNSLTTCSLRWFFYMDEFSIFIIFIEMCVRSFWRHILFCTLLTCHRRIRLTNCFSETFERTNLDKIYQHVLNAFGEHQYWIRTKNQVSKPVLLDNLHR